MSDVILYHNPHCGTSKSTLALLCERGIEPRVVEYLKTPPTRTELVEMIRRSGESVRHFLRKKGTPYEELHLGDEKWSDDQLIDFILQHPILLNRPVVMTRKGVRLCRPPETVLELL